MAKPKNKKDKKRKKKKRSMAKSADRYHLYLQSVQEPTHEVQFFNRVFKKEFGRKPELLREDFCGTAAVCYQWVKNKPDRRAIGVDYDPEPLDWGREHLAGKLKPADVERVELLQDDVRVVQGEKADIVAAQNFSFWIFKTRQEVLKYFRAAHKNAAAQSVFVLDMMGGPESMVDDEEEVTDKDDFDYVWEQVSYDPITHDVNFHIPFRFPDGSQLKKAFTYEWRMWSIPEVKELLLEAGFDRVDVYWEGVDEDGEGNNIFKVRDRGTADPAWICYIVAVKNNKR